MHGQLILGLCLLVILGLAVDSQFIRSNRLPDVRNRHWFPRRWPRTREQDCPPNADQIRCFVGACTIATCPAVPNAVCRTRCGSPCFGAFYVGFRRIPAFICNRGAK